VGRRGNLVIIYIIVIDAGVWCNFVPRLVHPHSALSIDSSEEATIRLCWHYGSNIISLVFFGVKVGAAVAFCSSNMLRIC
jgi:hypothetical protein